MTIVDALRTGRRFKRPRWLDYWASVNELRLTDEDLLATDYFLEDPEPKRRLYVDLDGLIIAHTNPAPSWKPLTRADFEQLFEGEEK